MDVPSFLARIAAVALIAAVSLLPRGARAERLTVVVKLLPSATDIDATRLRDEAARELRAPVLPPDDPAAVGADLLITVGEDRDRGELAVARRSAAGTLVRRVALPRDPHDTLRAAVFLIGNIARDEAGDLVSTLASSSPGESRSRATPASEARKTVWIGASFEAGLALTPTSINACKLAYGGEVTGAYRCTDGDADYPASGDTNGSIATDVSDVVRGGLVPLNMRFLAAVDAALDDNLLLGGRMGVATSIYPGNRSSAAIGHVHAEIRATYVAGAQPLAHAGVAMAFSLGIGLAEHSARVRVTVVDASRPKDVDAWRVAGPVFMAGGAGLRIAPTKSWAITALPARVGVAVGGGKPLFFVAPEVAVQIGFD